MATQMSIWNRGVIREYAPAPGLETLMLRRISKYKRHPSKAQIVARFRRYSVADIDRALLNLLAEGHLAVTSGTFWPRNPSGGSMGAAKRKPADGQAPSSDGLPTGS